MNLLSQFTRFIKNENLFHQEDKLVLAVSGGVDSVVLCELCRQAEFSFAIAHCNFQLRDEESTRDEVFVKSLGEKYDVDVLVKKFETKDYATQNKISIQVAARQLRYEWFKKLIATDKSQISGDKKIGIVNEQSRHKAAYILTGHHANDDIETLLMNFFKGTGVSGLRGIPLKANHIIRPLLFATKEEIKNFAEENKLSFIEDSSNASDKYTRNYFRNQLIPSIQKVFPQAENNLKDNIQRFKEIELLYHQSIVHYKKKLLEYKEEEIHIPVLKLLKAEPLKTILYEIIKDCGFTSNQITDVINLLQSESGKYIQSSTHKIIKNRQWLIISPNNTSIARHILIETDDRLIEFENKKLRIEKLSNFGYQISTDTNIALIDAGKIIFPLMLRKWKQGDYFYPLGMQKKKKLSRFFIDQKLSLAEKEKMWVIEANKKIIWVIGKRIDDRFKITANTKNTIRFSI